MRKIAELDGKTIVEAADLSLDAWLKIVLSPLESRKVCLYPDYCFPSKRHREEYLAGITGRDSKEVRSLIRAFLIPTGAFGHDADLIHYAIKKDPKAALATERIRRAVRGDPVWEGITWILDLLHRPRMAIQVVHAYLAAHFWWMPDWRVNGLFDAMTLIRSAYLEPLAPREELLALTPRDFEFVIALLFQRMGFQVKLTRQTADGGFDVRLKRREAGNVESSVVECKRYSENVPIKEMRALLGVVERDRLSRGLLVTTSGFTRTTRVEAARTHRIELVDFPVLCTLLNEHFGKDWLAEIDSITAQAHREFGADGTTGRKAVQQAAGHVR